MKFRELARQVMLSKGIDPSDIDMQMKLASGALPHANVDREIPPEHVDALREALSQLHDIALRDVEATRAVLAEGLKHIHMNN